MATVPLTTELDTTVKAELDQIAQYDNISTSRLLGLAAVALIEERKATRELVQVGLQLMEKGISISEEKMDAWFEGPDDAPFPEPDTFETK